LNQDFGRSLGLSDSHLAHHGRQRLSDAPGGLGLLIIFLAVMRHVLLDAIQEIDTDSILAPVSVLFDRLDHRAQDRARERIRRVDAISIFQVRGRERDRLQ
jgi:hypothetical protein